MKEIQPSANPLGCGCAVAAETIFPVIPTGLTWFYRDIVGVNTISKADLLVIAGMEISRIIVGAYAFNYFMSQSPNKELALVAGALYYLAAGVTEMFISADRIGKFYTQDKKR